MTTTTPAGQIDDELTALHEELRLEREADRLRELRPGGSGHLSAARGVTVTEEMRRDARAAFSRIALARIFSGKAYIEEAIDAALTAALASPSAQQGAEAPVPPQPPSGDGVELRTTDYERRDAIRDGDLGDGNLESVLAADVETLLAENARLRAALDARPGESADGWRSADTLPKGTGTKIRALMESDMELEEHIPAILSGGWHRRGAYTRIVGWKPYSETNPIRPAPPSPPAGEA